MLQGHTMVIVPCGNPTPKKMPTGGGEWPTFRTAHGTAPWLLVFNVLDCRFNLLVQYFKF